MYSFAPIADIPVNHIGFWIVVFIIGFALFLSLLADPYEFSKYFFIACMPVITAYGVSYHFTDQRAQTFRNEKVTGTFVGYQPEGYNERSGKSRSDVHYLYVVYMVNGNPVILHAGQGLEYPKNAILYKN